MKFIATVLETAHATAYTLQDSLKLKRTGIVTGGPHQEGRDCHIQQITRFQHRGKNYLLLARKGLVLDIYLDGREHLWFHKRKRLISSQVKSDFLVALEVNYEGAGEAETGWVRCCTGFGYCYFIPLDMFMGDRFNDFAMSFGMGGFVGVFQMFKFREETGGDDWKVMYTGKDRGVILLELDRHINLWRSKTKNIPSKLTGIKTNVTNGTTTPLDEPLWIQDLLLINEDGNFESLEILAVTKFGKLLKYVPNISKMPIDEFQVFDNLQIKSLHLLKKGLVMMNDAFNNFVIFDLNRWKIISTLRMITGSLSVVKTVTLDAALFTCVKSLHLTITSSNVDHYLRVYLLWESTGNKWYSRLISKQPTAGSVTAVDVYDLESIPMSSFETMISAVQKSSSKHIPNDNYDTYSAPKRSRII